MIFNLKHTLFYVEPTRPPEDAVWDTFTRWLFYQLRQSVAVELVCHGMSISYKPQNTLPFTSKCQCDAKLQSTIVDYKLPCGLVTHSLALHYIVFHRTEISNAEWIKCIRAWRPTCGEWSVAEKNIACRVANGDFQIPTLPKAASHLYITCETCGVRNFAGVRYKCLDCNINLCEKCEQTTEHPAAHAWLKLRQHDTRWDTDKTAKVKRQKSITQFMK